MRGQEWLYFDLLALRLPRAEAFKKPYRVFAQGRVVFRSSYLLAISRWDSGFRRNDTRAVVWDSSVRSNGEKGSHARPFWRKNARDQHFLGWFSAKQLLVSTWEMFLYNILYNDGYFHAKFGLYRANSVDFINILC